MIIRNVVPADLTANAVREIAAFVGADLADSTTWYGGAPQLDGVVPMHDAQSQCKFRGQASQFPISIPSEIVDWGLVIY